MKLRTTIVISSFGRQEEILRYVKFLKMYPINLIIVDGSKTFLDIEPSGCSSDFRLKYFNLQGENKYLDRVILGISHVESKYFCLMDDTDIILPSSLNIIEKWLDKKSNYFAYGQMRVLSKQEQNISIGEWGYWSKPLVAKDNSPLQRINSIFNAKELLI